MVTKSQRNSCVYCSSFCNSNRRRRFYWNICRRMNSSTCLIASLSPAPFRAGTARYLRALAVFYVRMTFRPVEVYEILEPLLKDYRKLRHLGMSAWSYSDSSIALLYRNRWLYANVHGRVCGPVAERRTSMRSHSASTHQARCFGGAG